MLDAEPDVATAGPENGADHHRSGGARLGDRAGRSGGGNGVAGGGGGLRVSVLVLGSLVSAFGLVVPERGAKALLGSGGSGSAVHRCGGEEARREESTEGVDLFHNGCRSK